MKILFDLKKTNNKILKNKMGVSLVMAMIAMGMLTSASYYLLGLNKSSTKNLKTSKNIAYLETERKRIASNMADKGTCLSNFTGFTGADVSKASLVHANLSTLAVRNNFYGGSAPGPKVVGVDTGNLKLTNIILGVRKKDPPISNPIQMDYTLQLEYTEWDMSTNLSAKTGGATPVDIKRYVVIPMFVTLTAGVISNCYSVHETSDIAKAVKDSCSPAAKAAVGPARYDVSALNENTAVATPNPPSIQAETCTHDVGFSGATPAIGTTCNYNTTSGSTVTQIISGVNDNISKLEVLNSHCTSFTAACPVSGAGADLVTQSAREIVSSGLTCDTAATTQCGTNQAIWKYSDSNSFCASLACANDRLLSTFSPLVCVLATPPTLSASCLGGGSSGTYITSISAANVATCARYSVLSRTCPGGQFGQRLTRVSGATNLVCAAYTKSKTCAAASPFTFAQNFNTGTTAGCETF